MVAKAFHDAGGTSCHRLNVFGSPSPRCHHPLRIPTLRNPSLAKSESRRLAEPACMALKDELIQYKIEALSSSAAQLLEPVHSDGEYL